MALSICLFVRSFVCMSFDKRVCTSFDVPASRSAARPPGTRVSQIFHPCEIYASGGGLLVASINAPQYFLTMAFVCQPIKGLGYVGYAKR